MAQNEKPATRQEKQKSGAPVPYRGGEVGWPGRESWGVNPFGLMRRLMEDFEPFFGGGTGLTAAGTWSPQVDVFQRDGQLVVRADVPGVNKGDVNVELTGDGLLIEGERKSEETREEGGLRHVERSYGRFQRLIPVPEGIDPAQANASFDNGVLEVTLPLPKEEAQQRRRIDIRDKGAASKAVH